MYLVNSLASPYFWISKKILIDIAYVDPQYIFIIYDLMY